MVAIAAQYWCKMLKTVTKQAVLNGEIGDETIYIRPPDWWPKPVSQGHALLLMKSMYGTLQAGRHANGIREFLDGWSSMTLWQSTTKRHGSAHSQTSPQVDRQPFLPSDQSILNNGAQGGSSYLQSDHHSGSDSALANMATQHQPSRGAAHLTQQLRKSHNYVTGDC